MTQDSGEEQDFSNVSRCNHRQREGAVDEWALIGLHDIRVDVIGCNSRQGHLTRCY